MYGSNSGVWYGRLNGRRSLITPFLQYSTRRDLRQKAYEAWGKRGEKVKLEFSEDTGRFSTPLDAFPRILAIAEKAAAHPAFEAAHPDRQPDADPS